MTGAAPRISIIVIAVGAPVDLVSQSVDSLRHQTAGDWDACVVASPDEIASLRAALDRAGLDGRLTLRATSDAVAPAAALAEALSSTSAELVTWLDAGDRLDPVAVERVLAVADDDVDFVYTDEDELDDPLDRDGDGSPSGPRLKPDWSPERLSAYPYTGRLAVFRRATLDEAGGIRPELALALDHDVALRVGERARRVVHVAEVLYHRRRPYLGMKPARATAAAMRAVAEHIDRTGMPATVEHDSERPRLPRLRPAG